MRFLKEWGRLLLVGDEWLDRILRWVWLAALLGLGIFLQQPVAIKVGSIAITPSVGVAVGLPLAVLWLVMTAGIALGREGPPEQTPAYLKHLSDLQAFAEKARNSIERVAVSIDLSNPIGRYFRSHYPDVAAKVDKWNQIDLGPKERDFWKVMQREEKRLGLMRNGTGMLATLAEGGAEFEQLTWSVENDSVVVRFERTMWQVADSPRGTAFEDMQREVRNHVPVLRALPEVLAYIAAGKDFEEQRATLVDDLETIVVNHRLTGRCNGCP